MTTRAEFVSAVVALATRAAATLPDARVLREQVKPTDFEQGQVLFTIPDPAERDILGTVGNCPPYYITDAVSIEVAAADTEAALRPRYSAAVAALERELAVDRSLGGLVKGMLWDGGAGSTQPVEGASGERYGEIKITAEYESASRLAD